MACNVRPEDTTSTTDGGGEAEARKRGGGGCCSKQIWSYRCRRSSTIRMMLAQAFVVLTSVSLVKAILLAILFDETTESSTQSWLRIPEIRAILPYLSYVVYPLTGSLLTGVQKRFDLVRRSLVVTWGATIGTSALLLLYETDHISVSSAVPVFVTAYLVLTLALAVFHSNLVPLGLEQLESASEQEVVTFLHAYLGLESFAYGIALLYPPLSLCDAADSSREAAVFYLSFACAALVTIATALTLLCQDHVTIEEPDASNPLKRIFQVAWYSKRVHYAVQTNTSGVPFTTKEVDDVKSFFHFLPHFLPLGLVMATNTATGSTSPHLLLANTTSCTTAAWAGIVPFVAIPAFVLLYHIHNLSCRGHKCMKLMQRVILGASVMLVCVFVDLVLALVQWEVTGWHLEQSTFLGLEVVVSVVGGVSVFLTASATVEFVCAQSSFPMKTVLVNLKYMADGLGTGVGVVLLATMFRLKGGVVWYLIAATVSAILAVVFSWWNAKNHRMRRRDEKRYEDIMAERVSIFSSLTRSSVTPEPSSVV
ncbi:hypothetical protein EMCRGX_G006679 [Ephydatia muelleri]